MSGWPHWFLYKGSGTTHFLVKPNDVEIQYRTDTNLERMLTWIRRHAMNGQIVNVFGPGVTEEGHRCIEGTWSVQQYSSGQRLRRESDLSIMMEMRRLGLHFVHPTVWGFGVESASTYIWAPEVGDYVGTESRYYPTTLNSSHRLRLRLSPDTYSVYHSLYSQLTYMGASIELMQALGIRPPRVPPLTPRQVVPAQMVSFDPRTGQVSLCSNSQVVGRVVSNVDGALTIELEPSCLTSQGAGNHAVVEEVEVEEEFKYGTEADMEIPSDVWEQESVPALGNRIHHGDLLSYQSASGIGWAVWTAEEDYLSDPDIREGASILRLSSKYRFRVYQERVLFGDILFRVSDALEEASRCVFFEDVGRYASDFELVLTRNDLCVPESTNICGDLVVSGGRGSGFRFVSPGEMLEIGDYNVSGGMVVTSGLRVLTANDEAKYARPIGYKQELAPRPIDLRDVELPEGYRIIRGSEYLGERLYLGLWADWCYGIREYDWGAFGEPPPHMRSHIVGKVSINEMSPTILPADVDGIRFIKKVETGEANHLNFNALILNVHGVMVIEGHLENWGHGARLATGIGSFIPMLFDIGGRERLVYVSDRLPANEITNRLGRGLGNMISASIEVAGAKLYVPAQHTTTTDYSHGRRVELCD